MTGQRRHLPVTFFDEPVAQFLRSETRATFRASDGSYQGLDLVTPVGATTLVIAMYLHACHPEAVLAADPFAAAAALGYPKRPALRRGWG